MELDGTTQIHIHGDLLDEMMGYFATVVILTRPMRPIVFVDIQIIPVGIDVDPQQSSMPIRYGKKLFIMPIDEHCV
jgi:hypothetical protein